MQMKSFGARILTVTAATAFLAACADTTTKDTTTTDTQPVVEQVATPDVSQVEMQGPKGGTQDHLTATAGDRVFFAYDSAELTAMARQSLRKQADWMKEFGGVKVTVEGHCDERGTREYNLALGERRASAAKNYLVALGVESSRLKTISYGKERPAVLGAGEGSWSLNRRSVLVVN